MNSMENEIKDHSGSNVVRGLVAGVLLLLVQGAAQADEQKRCLVIHVTQDDPKVWNQALNMASNVPKDLGMDNVMVEVVAQGPGLGLLTDESPHKARVASLSQYGAVFSACGNTIKAVEKKSGKQVTLSEGTRVVPAGVIRVMEMQEAGCSYVRP